MIRRTSGELLLDVVRRELVTPAAWHRLGSRLQGVGSHAEHWASYCEGLVAVQTTGRILKAAARLAEGREPDDPVFAKVLMDSIGPYFAIPYTARDDVVRFTRSAVAAMRRDIPDGVRNLMRRWSQRQHPHCYLCGAALDFTGADQRRAFSLDHLWPQSLGGESEEWNLLSACRDCNSWRGDLADWTSIGIQSLNLGLTPSDDSLARVGTQNRFRPHRFALLFHAAREMSERRQIDLKQALLQIGPPQASAQVEDGDDVADFFNLKIHD